MEMTAEHKAALALGRREARSVKAYLVAIASRKPGRPVTRESVSKRLAAIESKLASEEDPLKRLDLVQARINVEYTLASIGEAEDIERLEAEFASVARSYSERKGISYSAWREIGVSADVLKKAGVKRTRRG